MQTLSVNGEIILKRLLDATGDISIYEIQHDCNLSRKYVGVEIQKIDGYLHKHGAGISSRKGKGVCLEILEPDKFHRFREDFLFHYQRNQYLYLSKNQLAYRILFDLVLSDEYQSIDGFSEKYHYSRGTISSSLKKVKNILTKYGCEIISKPNYGLKIQSSEWNRRICLLYSNKIAVRMNSIIEDADLSFDKFFNKKIYNAPKIENLLISVFNKYQLDIPFVYLTKLKLYIVLSGSRKEWYGELTFSGEQLSVIEQSGFLPVSREISERLGEAGYQLLYNDINAITIFLLCFCSRSNADYDSCELVASCREDIEETVHYLKTLYYGIDNFLDEKFTDEFLYYLIEVKYRCLFEFPPDDEGVFQVKMDGSFLSDLSRDFAVFYYGKHGVKLSEAEILTASYIYHSSFARHLSRVAKYRVLLIARCGIHFARDAAARVIDEYGKQISNIDVVEFTAASLIDLSQYDFLITDIEQKRYNFLSLPLIRLDFFRFPTESHSLSRYMSMLTNRELQVMIKNENIIKDNNFKNKLDVYSYFGKHYVKPELKQEFIETSIFKNSLLSDERTNRIALISVERKYYSKEDIIILFNKKPFLWDNEPVQIIILFNRKNRDYKSLKTLNSVMVTFMHAHTGLLQNLLSLDAGGIIDFIIKELYLK